MALVAEGCSPDLGSPVVSWRVWLVTLIFMLAEGRLQVPRDLYHWAGDDLAWPHLCFHSQRDTCVTLNGCAGSARGHPGHLLPEGRGEGWVLSVYRGWITGTFSAALSRWSCPGPGTVREERVTRFTRPQMLREVQ